MPTHPLARVGLGHPHARVTGVYVAFALLWIWLSDLVLVWLGLADAQGFLPGAFKGTAFVAVTAAVLFWLVRREVAATRRSEALMRAVVEGTDDAVFVKDRNGKYLLFNTAAGRLVGKPAGDVIGRDDTFLFDPAGAAFVMARDRRVMATGRAETEEETLTAEGVTRTYLGTKAPYRDDSGAVVGVVGVSRDVTDARRAEQALRESEQRFRDLADAAPVLIWVSDTNKRCVWFNRRWLEFVGRSLEHEVGTGWADGVHPDDRERCDRSAHAAFDAREPFEMEYRLRRHDGEYRWVLATGAPRTAGGEFAGYIGSCVDITDRKRAEQSVRESEWRYRFALEAAAAGTWSWEAAVGDSRWDDQFHANYGFGPDQPQGFEAWAGAIHPDDRPRVLGRVDEMLRTPGDDRWEVHFRANHPALGVRWHHGLGRCERDAAGALTRMYGIDMDITDRKRAEDDLRESETRYRTLVENSSDAILLHRADGVIIDANPAATRMLGRGYEELAGATPLVFDPDATPDRMADILASLDAGTPLAFDTTHHRKDGSTFPAEVRVRPFKAGGGRFAISTVRDITDRKRAEQALRASEERLRLALEVGGLGTWDVDLRSGRIVWSDDHYAMHGYAAGEVPPSFQAWLDRVHSDDRAASEAALNAARDTREAFAFEFRAVHPDGAVRWLSARGRYFYDEAGTPVRMVGVGRDITEQRQAAEALRQSEERLRLALEAAHLAVWEVRLPDGDKYPERVNHWDEAYGRLFGLTPDQLPRAESEFFALVHPDDQPAVAAAFEGCVAGGPDYVVEFRVICPDGQVRWHASSGRLLRAAAGGQDRVIGVGRDVTAEREAERALRLARFSVERAVEAIFWIAPSGEIQYANHAAHQVLGYQPGELAGRTVPDIDPNFTAESWPPHWEEVKARGSFTFESDHRTKDGQTILTEVTVNYLRHEDREYNCAVMRDVTARKGAEAAARESERRLAAFMENTPTLAWVNDEFGRTHLVNPAWERTYGKTADDLRGRPMLQTLAGHPADDYLESDRRVLDTGAPYTAVETGPRGGGTGTYLVTKFPLGRTADGCRLVGGVAVDITDRAAGEAALRASEERLRLALTAGRMGTFDWDLATDRVVWSDTHYLMWGYPPGDRPPVTFHTFADRVHPEDRAVVEATLDRSRRTRTPYRHEHRIVIPSGEVRWVAGHGEFSFAADGTPVRMLGTAQDVTDRKVAELAMTESEERLRLALTAAAAIGFVWDAATDSVVRYFSTVPTLPVNLDAPEPVAAVRDRVHPDDVPAFDAGVGACLQHGTDYRNLYRVLDPDGGVRWLEEWGTLARAADGRPLRLTGISIDVTDRKRAEEAVRASEERYRRLVEVLPVSVHVIDGGRLTYCNPACQDLFGGSAADLRGKTPYELVHPDSHRVVSDRIAAIARSADIVPYVEVKVVRMDGTTRTVHALATPFRGDHPDAHLVCLTDVTERQRTDRLMQSLLASVADAILTVDANGTVWLANPATERLFGYAAAEMIGRNVSELMPQPYRGEHDRYIADYLRTGDAKVIGIGREVSGRRKDGTEFPVDLTVTELRLGDERHFTGVVRDITARKRLEEQFRQAQKMEAVGRLAGGVAHDFNNLLTVINGYCELLLDGGGTTPGGRSSVAAIRDAGERAARLTQQLLAFSRKTILAPKVIDLNDLVSESAKLLRRLIGEDVILAVVTAPTPVRVKADPGQLEQVVMNLAVNARDAMPTGGRLTLETWALAAAAGDPTPFACLSVADTGQGMTDEVRANIFEPFFTTKGVGKGTGLGLAVVHGVVVQSGGRIEVESAVGRGTTFRLMLPLAVAEATGAAAEATPVAARGSETVLLVEDEDAVRAIARLSLELQGYTVLEADCGAEALRRVAAHSGAIHLLVTDVVMPEMGGRQLLEAVRRYRPGLRVLFMSGYTDDAVLRHGVEEAADAFIQKPFSPFGLARKVREVLDAPAR